VIEDKEEKFLCKEEREHDSEFLLDSASRPLLLYASQVWEALVSILPVLLPHLDWWTHRENVLTGVALLHTVPSLTLYTDSSLQGWGAFLEGKRNHIG
jgi:hypothetical protein